MDEGFFTTYKIPFELDLPGVNVTLIPEGEGFLYRRVQGEESVEKLLFPGPIKNVTLLPVEPVNLPASLAQQLFISFKKPLIIPPMGRAQVYLRFPVEVGVLLKKGKEWRSVDIFTLAMQKLTFVGEFEGGRISRYYESDLHTKIPQVDPTTEGVIWLKVHNRSDNWKNLENLIVPAEDITLYYAKDLVGMVVQGTVLKTGVMRVKVRDTPPKKGMKRSQKLFRTRALKKVARGLRMEGI